MEFSEQAAPPEFSLHHSARVQKAPNLTTREDLKQRLDASIQEAYASLHRTQPRYKRDFDKRIRRTKNTLPAGDHVFLDSTDAVKKLRKLQHTAEGPYRVLKNDKRTVSIDRKGVIELVFADRCAVSADSCAFAPSPFDTPPGSRTNPTADGIPQATKVDLSQKVNDGPTSTVDRIIDHRTTQIGNPEFLLKWTGYDEPSWTPQTHISEEFVSRYRLRVSRSDRRRPQILRRQHVSA